MDLPTVYLGLDYHRTAVQLCAIGDDGQVLGNGRCENDWRAIVRWSGERGVVRRVAVEACGGAADLAEELVTCAGWSVDLAHPGYVHRMKGTPDKTDYSDARVLADLTRVGYLPKVWLAPESIRELRRLVRYRQQLINERRAVKLRVRALLRDHRIREMTGKPWTKRWLMWLTSCEGLGEHSAWILQRHISALQSFNAEIREVERRLDQTVANDAMVAALMAQPGVGPVTAWTIRAEIGRFDRFNSGKQVARFCGMSPRNASSGERQADAGLIKAGSTHLRATIIEASWRLIRCDARWGRLARAMIDRGKPKCVVAAAIGNRWIRKLYHEMRPLGLAA